MRIGYGNLLAQMSLSNPRLTRQIFTKLMNNRVEKNSENLKKNFNSYDKNLANALKNNKNLSEEQINDAVEKANKKLAARGYNTSLYNGKSLIQENYSSLGGLFNYFL